MLSVLNIFIKILNIITEKINPNTNKIKPPIKFGAKYVEVLSVKYEAEEKRGLK